MPQSSSKDSADSALRSALAQAICWDGFVPLVSSPKTGEGLFAYRKPPNKKVIARCLDADRPLLIIRSSGGTAPGQKVLESAQITDKGVATLVRLSQIEDFPRLVSQASATWKGRVLSHCLRAIVKRSGESSRPSSGAVIRECFDAAQRHLDELSRKLDDIVTLQDEIADAVTSFSKSTATGLSKQIKRLTDEGKVLGEARAALVAPPEVDGLSPSVRNIGWERMQVGISANSEAALDFQRGLSQELIFAWQDSRNPEVRENLERVLYNVGVERIGSLGDAVVFDGSVHKTSDDLIPGEAAVVELPGWQLVNRRGVYLLAPVRVSRASSVQEGTHRHVNVDQAPHAQH